jgi:hypothetical protein
MARDVQTYRTVQSKGSKVVVTDMFASAAIRVAPAPRSPQTRRDT